MQLNKLEKEYYENSSELGKKLINTLNEYFEDNELEFEDLIDSLESTVSNELSIIQMQLENEKLYKRMIIAFFSIIIFVLLYLLFN